MITIPRIMKLASAGPTRRDYTIYSTEWDSTMEYRNDRLLWFWMMKMVFMSSRILLWNFDLVLELYDRTHPEQR